jgi:hypothetical protein
LRGRERQRRRMPLRHFEIEESGARVGTEPRVDAGRVGRQAGAVRLEPRLLPHPGPSERRGARGGVERVELAALAGGEAPEEVVDRRLARDGLHVDADRLGCERRQRERAAVRDREVQPRLPGDRGAAVRPAADRAGLVEQPQVRGFAVEVRREQQPQHDVRDRVPLAVLDARESSGARRLGRAEHRRVDLGRALRQEHRDGAGRRADRARRGRAAEPHRNRLAAHRDTVPGPPRGRPEPMRPQGRAAGPARARQGLSCASGRGGIRVGSFARLGPRCTGRCLGTPATRRAGE